jgi:phospholipid-binding lipoprotein MlaA
MRATIARTAALALLLTSPLLGARVRADEIVLGGAEDDLSEDYYPELGEPVPDPIEPLNRQFFLFNDRVDQLLLLPVTQAYQFVVPELVRICIRRSFRNLRSPVYFVNNLFQLRFKDAAETLAGFALNSTAGVGGLFDAAAEAGWHAHSTDFGQTLGVYGVHSGPYLVIPLLGPSTLRDSVGDVVDRAFDPFTYFFGMGGLIFLGTSSGFVAREANSERLQALRSSSVDYYSAMRSAFTQNRESQIAELRQRNWWNRQWQAAETPAPAPLEAETQAPLEAEAPPAAQSDSQAPAAAAPPPQP